MLVAASLLAGGCSNSDKNYSADQAPAAAGDSVGFESGQTFAIDRSSQNGLPSVTATTKAWGTVTVQAIDYDNRTIALAGPNGNSEIFSVPPSVVNFNQIKQGDVVKVKYEETLNASVAKVGQPLDVQGTQQVELAAIGQKPGVTAIRTVTTQANVTAIDYAARKVTLVGLNGKSVVLHVSDKLQDFDKVAVGDQVTFTYTEEVSINVGK